MLPEPHGGRLVDRTPAPAEAARRKRDVGELPRLHPHPDELYDLEKIAIGAYSPLEGFMDASTVDSVLRRSRLPNGLPWTLPVVLAPRRPEERAVVEGIVPGEEVALYDDRERPVGILRVESRFPLDRTRIAREAFGTTDPAHPNVRDLLDAGDTALAGPIQLLEPLELPARRLEWSPAETRAEFQRRGWSQVAAYQCRNPPHVAHEYLQRCTLEREEIDGLFVHPVVGRLKHGDYRPEVILRAYEALLANYYPPARVALAALSITMRYAGPKAALFLAIVRKNYGCSHYIVGRDQAGVGRFYDPYACHRIFDELDIGIVPLRYDETFFCRRCGWTATGRTCAHPPESHLDTSQSRIRAALLAGQPVPPELLRPEVAAALGGPESLLD